LVGLLLAVFVPLGGSLHMKEVEAFQRFVSIAVSDTEQHLEDLDTEAVTMSTDPQNQRAPEMLYKKEPGSFQKLNVKLGVVVHSCNPSTWEVDSGGS
jgi:hypothetical protein